jgi:outer membrane lipoprotein-sorting protein
MANNGVWRFSPNDDQIYEFPDSPSLVANLSPTPFRWEALASARRARIIGHGKLGGRATTIVQIDEPFSLQAQPSQVVVGAPASETLKIWIDTQNYQLLQMDRILRDVAGRVDEEIDFTVIVNEVEDVSQFPPGFFSYTPPPGAEVLHPSNASRSTTPAPQLSP